MTTGTVQVEVTWWWTPDCGYLHAESAGTFVSISPHCPDGIKPDDELPPPEEP